MGNKTTIKICGRMVHLGDWVKIRYTTGTWSKGGEIKGEVTELWERNDGFKQAQINHGWCFHDNDEILEHRLAEPERKRK